MLGLWYNKTYIIRPMSPLILETVRENPTISKNHQQEVIGTRSPNRVKFDDYKNLASSGHHNEMVA